LFRSIKPAERAADHPLTQVVLPLHTEPIMMKTITLLLSVLILSLTASAQKAKSFYTSGFYNGIEMTSKESGDYGGISVYLTQSANDTFALVTEAEGAIFDPKLVPVKVSGKDMRSIEFTLPGDNGDRRFKGTVTAAALKLSSGGQNWTLKRQCASTYSDIAVSKASGDAAGTELYITDSGGRWWVLYTIAEGEVAAPVLVEAKVTGKNYDKFEFATPGDPVIKFQGVRGAKNFTLKYEGGQSVLRPKCYQ
jgi:myo-inositol-hexaphosphate 3-phosphohydrolase